MIRKVLPKRKKLFLSFFVLFFFISSWASIAQLPSPNSQKKIIKQLVSLLDKFVITSINKKGDPGCVVAVVGPQDVYFLKSYGVKQIGKSAPLTSKTLFQLGSVSKPLIATLALRLQAQNKISVETPVTTYLKEFKLQDQKDPLRVKHILSHTTGVPRYGFNALIENSSSRNALFQKVQRTPLTAQPGLIFDYHNVMFSLMEEILSASMQQPFEKTLQEHLFNPLNMKYASTGLNSLTKATDRAIPHITNKKGKVVYLKNYYSVYYNVTAAAGINASMEDLIPFLQLQLGGFPQLLSSKEKIMLHNPQITAEKLPFWLKKYSKYIGKTGYTLGWHWIDYKGERVLLHGGWVKGFTPAVVFLPQYDIGLIILHHAETGLTLNTIFKFLDLYLELLSQNEEKSLSIT